MNSMIVTNEKENGDMFMIETQPARRYTPIAISRSLAARAVSESVDRYLDEDMARYKSQDSGENVQTLAACWLCDCSNNCFCYPICGCNSLYNNPHNLSGSNKDARFTLCPCTSITADNSCFCTDINADNYQHSHPASRYIIRHQVAMNTACIPMACVVDMITLLPRCLLTIFVNTCCDVSK
jgi:hypothetical protein